MKPHKIASIALAATFGFMLADARAQAPSADAALGECMVKAATPNDREVLVKWVFSALAAHPQLVDMSSLDAASRDALDGEMARLFERLMVDDCTVQARNALADDAGDAFGAGFKVLGEVAMTGLIDHPEVQGRIAGFAGKVDDTMILRALLKAGK